MLRIGFWKESEHGQCLILAADASVDLLLLRMKLEAVGRGRTFLAPGGSGIEVGGLKRLEIEQGEAQVDVSDDAISLRMPDDLLSEAIGKIDAMMGSADPSHNYIDMDGLTIIVSVGEVRPLT